MAPERRTATRSVALTNVGMASETRFTRAAGWMEP